MEVFTSELAVSCFIKSLRTLPRKHPNSLLHIETVSQPADLLLAGTYKKNHHSGCDEYKFNNRFSECECGCRLAGRELQSNNGEETTRVCTQGGSVRETAGRSGWRRRRREEGMQSLEREGERGKSTAGPEDFLFSHAGAELEIVTAGAKVDHRLLSSIFSPFSDFSHMRFSFFLQRLHLMRSLLTASSLLKFLKIPSRPLDSTLKLFFLLRTVSRALLTQPGLGPSSGSSVSMPRSRGSKQGGEKNKQQQRSNRRRLTLIFIDSNPPSGRCCLLFGLFPHGFLGHIIQR